MILPTVAAISQDALHLVPYRTKEAAYGMGATRWEVILKVMVPTASGGIFSAMVLGFGRALGETMALAMLIGNSNADRTPFAACPVFVDTRTFVFSESTMSKSIALIRLSSGSRWLSSSRSAVVRKSWRRSSSRRGRRSATGSPRRDRDEGRHSDGLTTVEREELRRLRREIQAAQARARDPVKSRGLVRAGDEGDSVEGFQFVSAHRALYPIATMCRVLGVSTSGYYAWSARSPSARATSDAALLERIDTVHAASRGTYGSPRIHAELVATGSAIGRKRVARLMKGASLRGVCRRRFVTTTVRDSARQAPDLVDRNFVATAPNVLWVADITYVPTWSGFLYLAVVLDVFSRRASAGRCRRHCKPSWCWQRSTWPSPCARRAA